MSSTQSSSTDLLFQSFDTEKLTLKNRVVMAPMTRNFSPNYIPGEDVAEYYAQMGYGVEILTGDQGLKAYEPVTPVKVPRRRQR